MSISTTEVRVGDVMISRDHIAVVTDRALLKEALEAMSARKLGIVCIVDRDGKLAGVFTDGDVRRMLLRDQKPFAALFADDVLTHAARTPVTSTPETLLTEAVRMMEGRRIWDIPVVDGDRRLLGLLHLHPAVKALLGM